MSARRVRHGLLLRIHIAFGCALLSLGITAVAAGAQAGGGTRDPLKLFEPMYPVFTSARCANCHGTVDPIHGINHDKIDDVPLDGGDMLPGRDGNSQCLECHDENADASVWRLAPSQLAFGGKGPLDLCKQIRGDNGLQDGDAQSFAKFLDHLSGDQLIGMAFEGKRGMTENDSQPPPVDRATFVGFARRWLQEGKAKCSPWNGTITQHIVQTRPITWDVTVEVSVKDGEARAQVHGTGHEHQTGQGCFVRDDTFTVDTENSTVPVDLSIMLNRDLATSIPQLPVPINLPPGVPAPPQFGTNNGYTLTLLSPDIDGKDHWEQGDKPPACTHRSGDDPLPYKVVGLLVNKMLDPNKPDHLQDTDTQQGPDGSSITTTWDLTRE